MNQLKVKRRRPNTSSDKTHKLESKTKTVDGGTPGAPDHPMARKIV
jgi:hypothetical protein